MKSYTTIDAYIKSFPKPVQANLQSFRAAIHKVSPKFEEAIRYGMPTFRFNDENVVHFAAYKTHIGFYPAPSGINAFKKELSEYSTSKGCVRFSVDKPLPLQIIMKIVKFRLAEVIKKDVTKTKDKKKLVGIFGTISAPAERALANAKIKNVKDLAKWTEQELLKLHGIGPTAIPKLRDALKREGLKFKK